MKERTDDCVERKGENGEGIVMLMRYNVYAFGGQCSLSIAGCANTTASRPPSYENAVYRISFFFSLSFFFLSFCLSFGSLI